MDFQAYFSQHKQQLEERDQYRSLQLPSGIDFCSNDYLSFSQNPNIKDSFIRSLVDYPLGSTGSRLLRGQNSLVLELEDQLAGDAGAESALVLGTGYQANLALLTGVLTADAAVFSDELNHASLIDGIRLAQCHKQIFRHNDIFHLAKLIQATKTPGPKFVVVESLYSMTGDFAPLKDLSQLCAENGAHLIVDEAHATGLFGERGSGRVAALGLQSQVFARIHTAGKALGVSGAWITGPQNLKELLVNKSRPFIYSTGPSFPQILLLKAAWEYWQNNGLLLARQQLARVSEFRKNLQNELGPNIIREADGPIVSIVLGENSKALAVAEDLQVKGFDIRAIRPPTVPVGQSMLRITLPLARTFQEVANLSTLLVDKIKELRQ